MIVVADTTSHRYLVVIEREHLLPALYGRVIIPRTVAEELSSGGTPGAVRAWLVMRPDWLEIRQPAHALPPEVDLDPGERDAIALAVELAADLLLMDDWDGRLEAERRHLPVAGTLRVLADGAIRGLTDLAESFDRLRKINFRVDSELLQSLLEDYRRHNND